MPWYNLFILSKFRTVNSGAIKLISIYLLTAIFFESLISICNEPDKSTLFNDISYSTCPSLIPCVS